MEQQNQYQNYLRLASKILTERSEEDKCIWKHILGDEGQVEGRLRRCNDNCDGYNYNCEYYISQREVHKYR